MIWDMRQYKNKNINIFNTMYCPIDDKIVYTSTIDTGNNDEKDIETKQQLNGTILGLKTQKKILEDKLQKYEQNEIKYHQKMEQKKN